METGGRWIAIIDVSGDGRTTTAQARLRDPAGPQMLGIGTARLRPGEPHVPEIGDELAVGRALATLACQLIDAAAGDLQAGTRQPA